MDASLKTHGLSAAEAAVTRKARRQAVSMKTGAWLRLGDDCLDDARRYPSRTAAVVAFREIAQELWRYGQRIEATVHLAATRGELAEYPDWVLSVGPRGGVVIDAA